MGRGHVFVTQGDITLLSADVVAYSTDRSLSLGGQLTFAFFTNLPGFEARYRALSATIAAKPEDKPVAGKCFFLETSSGTKPRGVVVAVATGARSPRIVRARAAVEGALRCAIEHLARLEVPKPWRIALPAFLTGDGGARHDRLAVAEPQVESALEFVEDHEDIDVVFVTYTAATYQVYLEARRRVRATRAPHSSSSPSAHPALAPPEELVESLRSGECVLFVGSGISVGSGLPGWPSLIEELADDLGIERAARRDGLDWFLDLAQWYREERKRPTLARRIESRFSAESTGAKPTLAHYLLTSLPVRYWITTNYDELLELALDAHRRHPQKVVSERDVARTGGRDGCYVVKFHGDAPTRRGIVISRDDYDRFFDKRPAMALLLEGLLLNQSFFFLGYGLRDPDFRQIYHRIAVMLRGAKRSSFATTFESTSTHAHAQWRKKHLELIDVPGEGPADKSRALDLFLDRLAEAVADDPRLFLADDVERPLAPHVTALRDELLRSTHTLADAILHAAGASPSEVRTLAEVLRFLTARGWRGEHPGQLSTLFSALAAYPGLRKSERHDLLVAALGHTESGRDAEAVRQMIEALEEPRPPAGRRAPRPAR